MHGSGSAVLHAVVWLQAVDAETGTLITWRLIGGNRMLHCLTSNYITRKQVLLSIHSFGDQLGTNSSLPGMAALDREGQAISRAENCTDWGFGASGDRQAKMKQIFDFCP